MSLPTYLNFWNTNVPLSCLKSFLFSPLSTNSSNPQNWISCHLFASTMLQPHLFTLDQKHHLIPSWCLCIYYVVFPCLFFPIDWENAGTHRHLSICGKGMDLFCHVPCCILNPKQWAPYNICSINVCWMNKKCYIPFLSTYLVNSHSKSNLPLTPVGFTYFNLSSTPSKQRWLGYSFVPDTSIIEQITL